MTEQTTPWEAINDHGFKQFWRINRVEKKRFKGAFNPYKVTAYLEGDHTIARRGMSYSKAAEQVIDEIVSLRIDEMHKILDAERKNAKD
jgi:hypothetical protein